MKKARRRGLGGSAGAVLAFEERVVMLLCEEIPAPGSNSAPPAHVLLPPPSSNRLEGRALAETRNVDGSFYSVHSALRLLREA